jgi:hypothetical protein
MKILTLVELVCVAEHGGLLCGMYTYSKTRKITVNREHALLTTMMVT